ncbi:MAG TPA: GNAT family N-acetyltransferase [Candidatus Binatia bacterium]|jgi:ribosomal protein S18 acetylase RimI-like enzyme|nr:GNAT family N-acetyltransferase [Candidatus Binatia bacterium]
MATLVRAARDDDAAFVAWTILMASRSHLTRGAWDIALDLPTDGVLAMLERLALSTPPSFCSTRGFLIAEVDGTPTAALSAYDPGLVAAPDPAIDAVLIAMGWSQDDIGRSNARFAPFMTCTPAQEHGTWIVEWVATRPELRRRGLVERLLGDILALGRERGYVDAQIAILMGNTPAQRAYEKMGFRLTHERTHPDFAALVGCPGMAELHQRL